MMISTPTMPVAEVMAASTVASVSAGAQPAAVQACTTALAIEDRKIKPTSCTWPVAPGGSGTNARVKGGCWQMTVESCGGRGAAGRATHQPQHRAVRGPGEQALGRAKGLIDTEANVQPCIKDASTQQRKDGIHQRDSAGDDSLRGSPTAKGRELRAAKASWWMAEERNTSFTRLPSQGRKKGSWWGQAWGQADVWVAEEERGAAGVGGGDASGPSACAAATRNPAVTSFKTHPEDDGSKGQLHRQRNGRIDGARN